MITTITFLMSADGVTTGVGAGDGEGDEEVELFTPPHPMIRARMGTVKKTKRSRLKAALPQIALRELLPSQLA